MGRYPGAPFEQSPTKEVLHWGHLGTGHCGVGLDFGVRPQPGSSSTSRLWEYQEQQQEWEQFLPHSKPLHKGGEGVCRPDTGDGYCLAW